VSKPQYIREAAQVQQAHPGLDSATARRVAEQYVEVARETGTPVSELLAESVRAEGGSFAGNASAP
jgi:hypothetical protein